MIFEINAGQVGRLNEVQLVELLRRLIQAELNKNGIPMRSGNAPAQIHIPDGGDDARVTWIGGPNETDWLPNRFTIFQSKKGKTTPASLKAETHKKSSQGSRSPILNEALEELLRESGAYVVVTASSVVGTNIDRRIESIREGISATGNDPTRLSSIQIYDCNRLAAWANTHYSVALWVNALLREISLGGFQTYELWGRAPEISKIEFQSNEDTRFVAKGTEVQIWEKEDDSISKEKSFSDIGSIIGSFFLEKGNAIRVTGPSGYGKTRFVNQLIASQGTLPQDVLDESQIIYCIYEDVKNQVLNLVREISDSGSSTLLIIDDCPDPIHLRLSDIVNRENSRCLLITVGVDTKAHGLRNNLVVELNAASEQLINQIAEAANKEISSQNSSLIRELSQGFPRMAVYASRALEDGDEKFSSVEAIISRIIWGEHEENQSAYECLQILSLFTIVGLENDVSHELEQLANFCDMSAHDMYKKLNRFTERGVLFRQGDFGEVQPLPLAMRLANQWLDNNPSGSLKILYNSLSDEMKLRMIGRLRWVSWSPKVIDFARKLIVEALPNDSSLNTEFGSKLFDRCVHLAPDETMERLSQLLATKSIEELKELNSGRRNIVWALGKLVFRQETFNAAARLLLKLGAAENEEWSNNASGQFKGLYQLYLSGTEATPAEKIILLDEGLAAPEEEVRWLSVQALDRMLATSHFSRSGGSEHIGASEAMKDWRPQKYGEIYDYYRYALTRLEKIALCEEDSNSIAALNFIGSHLRGLLSFPQMFEEIREMIGRILEIHPAWGGALMAVNHWLYFDKNSNTIEHQSRVRDYYDEIYPKDTLGQLAVFSSSYLADLHDPDVPYERDGNNDYSYGTNKIVLLVEASPKIAGYFTPLLETFLEKPHPSMGSTMLQIALHVEDPENLLKNLLILVEDKKPCEGLSNLIRGIISGASQANLKRGRNCLEIALDCTASEANPIEFMSVAKLDDDLMRRIIDLVHNDEVVPHSIVDIGFDDLHKVINERLLEELINTLLKKSGAGAWASILFSSRLLYRASLEESNLQDCLIKSVLNPSLFSTPRRTHMDWYYWCELVKKILNDKNVSELFYAQLTDFIINVIDVEDYSIQLDFDDHAREILRRLIEVRPSLVWEKYQEKREKIDPTKLYSLESLFGAGVSSPTKPGVLNKIPEKIYISWMLKDKKNRMPLILGWLELFVPSAKEASVYSSDDAADWSPRFVSFINEHIDDSEMLNNLHGRLTTGSWMGSYANKIEREKERLVQLKTVSTNRNVQLWIDKVISHFDLQINEERRRDANREASYRT